MPSPRQAEQAAGQRRGGRGQPGSEMRRAARGSAPGAGAGEPGVDMVLHGNNLINI